MVFPFLVYQVTNQFFYITQDLWEEVFRGSNINCIFCIWMYLRYRHFELLLSLLFGLCWFAAFICWFISVFLFLPSFAWPHYGRFEAIFETSHINMINLRSHNSDFMNTEGIIDWTSQKCHLPIIEKVMQPSVLNFWRFDFFLMCSFWPCYILSGSANNCHKFRFHWTIQKLLDESSAETQMSTTHAFIFKNHKKGHNDNFGLFEISSHYSLYTLFKKHWSFR